MPIVSMHIEGSTLAVTSAVSAAITFGFCVSAGGMKPVASIGVAIAVGLFLYTVGVIPVGIILAVGFAMVVAIFKSVGNNVSTSSQQFHSSNVSREPPVANNTGSPGKFWIWVFVGMALLVVGLFVSRQTPSSLTYQRDVPVAPAAPIPEVGTTVSPASSFERLAERLRASPPFTIALPEGEAWLVSAYSGAGGRLRIIVKFRLSKPGASLLRGRPKSVISLIRQSFCGSDGLLASYGLVASAIDIIAYEGETSVGEFPLPKGYCQSVA